MAIRLDPKQIISLRRTGDVPSDPAGSPHQASCGEGSIQQGGVFRDGEGGRSGDGEEGKTGMLMKRWGILRRKKDNLVRDLKETTLSFEKLGKKYGVSRQGIYSFSKRQGIKRPKRPREHQIEECRLCQKLIQISKRPHSEFISTHTIKEKTGASRAEYFNHLRILRDRGLISQRFGKFRSKRLEEAYAIYFKKRLRIHTIGRKADLKNFHAIIRQHRRLGYDVPPSLYISDGGKRSRVRNEIQRRKKG